MLCAPLEVPRLMQELEAVSVKVGDIGGVVAGGEVGAIRWFAPSFDCSCIGYERPVQASLSLHPRESVCALKAHSQQAFPPLLAA